MRCTPPLAQELSLQELVQCIHHGACAAIAAGASVMNFTTAHVLCDVFHHRRTCWITAGARDVLHHWSRRCKYSKCDAICSTTGAGTSSIRVQSEDSRAFRLAVARRLIGADSVARASLSQDASSVMNSTIGAQVLHHCRSWCDERHHWRPAATTAGAGTLRTTTARVPRSRQELVR